MQRESFCYSDTCSILTTIKNTVKLSKGETTVLKDSVNVRNNSNSAMQLEIGFPIHGYVGYSCLILLLIRGVMMISDDLPISQSHNTISI